MEGDSPSWGPGQAPAPQSLCMVLKTVIHLQQKCIVFFELKYLAYMRFTLEDKHGLQMSKRLV